jgi:serine/threonine protein phosphatase PrpC
MQMSQTFLFDQGDADRMEDGLIRASNIVGVIDAAGTPYNSKLPMRTYGELSSGEKAVRVSEGVFNQPPKGSLVGLVLRANEAIRSFQAELLASPELLAGICFASARINKSDVEVAQIGDCFAVIEQNDGKIIISPYQSAAHEAELRKIREDIFVNIAHELYGCIPDEVPEKERANFRSIFWERIFSPWMELRRKNINRADSKSGYGFINGQKESLEFVWYRKFPINKVKRILLCTDGMISPKILDEGNILSIGRWLTEKFNIGGWAAVLEEVRSIEKDRESRHFTSACEVTGYSITLS